MKKLAILSAIALSSLICSKADAQISVHFGFRLFPHRVVYAPLPPPQAPEVVEQEPVYDAPQYLDYDDSYDDDYYYLPDVDAYYNVNAHCYYYNDGYNWVTTAYLPGHYRNFDWRSARRFEIRENRPYMRNDFYRSHYKGRQVAEWRNFRHENHFGGGYRNSDHFNRDAYRGNENRFYHGGDFGRPGRNRDANRFGGQGYRPQPDQNNGGHDRGQPGSFGRPHQDNGNHYQQPGNFSQPDGNSRNHDNGNRPSNQNNGGDRNRRNENGGGNSQFARNSQPMGMTHRGATRF